MLLLPTVLCVTLVTLKYFAIHIYFLPTFQYEINKPRKTIHNIFLLSDSAITTFCIDSNPDRRMLETYDGENLWHLPWLKIELMHLHGSTILWKPFFIILIFIMQVSSNDICRWYCCSEKHKYLLRFHFMIISYNCWVINL